MGENKVSNGMNKVLILTALENLLENKRSFLYNRIYQQSFYKQFTDKDYSINEIEIGVSVFISKLSILLNEIEAIKHEIGKINASLI
jgi:hypothetical protein